MSFQYHPLVLFGASVAMLELASWLLAKLFHRPSLIIGHYHFFVLAGAFLTVFNWIFKNYMLLVNGVDLLPPIG